jgi:hypothetical protein
LTVTHNRHVIKTTGIGVYVVFTPAIEGASAAITAQRACIQPLHSKSAWGYTQAKQIQVTKIADYTLATQAHHVCGTLQSSPRSHTPQRLVKVLGDYLAQQRRGFSFESLYD